MPPPLPVIVSGNVPVPAFLFVEIDSVEVPEPATDAGLKDALTRDGTPVTLKLTVAPNDPAGVIVTVYVACEPRFTVRVLGETEMVKSATTSVTCVV